MWLLENFKLHMWLAYVAHIIFLFILYISRNRLSISCADLDFRNTKNLILTLVVAMVGGYFACPSQGQGDLLVTVLLRQKTHKLSLHQGTVLVKSSVGHLSMYLQVQGINYHYDLVCSLHPLISPSSFILEQSPELWYLPAGSAASFWDSLHLSNNLFSELALLTFAKDLPIASQDEDRLPHFFFPPFIILEFVRWCKFPFILSKIKV